MQLIKALGFAGALILSAVIGGTVIGTTQATDDPPGIAHGADDEYCDVFIETLTSELGVTREALVAAGQSAADAAIDAAVAAGDLSEERATALRERVDEYDGTGCGWIGPGVARGFSHGPARGFLGGDVFQAAADALGIESSELIGELREAGSLEELADELGVAYEDVRGSILSAVQADLDAAVAEGLAQERADDVIDRLTVWLDGGGQLDGFGPGPFGGHVGPHHWQPDGDQEDPGA